MISTDGNLIISNNEETIKVTRNADRVTLSFSSWTIWKSFRKSFSVNIKPAKFIKESISVKIEEKEIVRIKRGKPSIISFRGFIKMIWTEITNKLKIT